MKHDRINRVANRQRESRMRDALVAILGAGLLAFQLTAFGVSLSGASDSAFAATKSAPAELAPTTAESGEPCRESQKPAADVQIAHC